MLPVTPALRLMMVWALLSCTIPGGMQGSSTEKRRQKISPSIKLTLDHPAGSFPLSEDIVVAAPPFLGLQVARVVNPSQTPVEFFVYIYPRPPRPTDAKNKGQPQRFLVGTFGLFPADQPAGFILRASGAFAQLSAARRGAQTSGARLMIQMKPLRKLRTPAQLEVTIAVPQWQSQIHK